MKIEIVQGGKVLRTHAHEDLTYAEAPASGEYAVRLTNDHPKRRLAVVSVDGINVIDGSDAGYAGPGYLLGPWQSIEIPGWRRDGEKVAAFDFKEQGASYAARSGRGTSNVGVIGVAAFDEAVRVTVPPVEHHHHYPPFKYIPYIPWTSPDIPYIPPPWTMGTTEVTFSSDGGVGRINDATKSVYSTSCLRGAGPQVNCSVGAEPAEDVGTAYGRETTFHTQDVDFQRASESPSLVVELRYATRARLKKMGVDVDGAPASKKAPSAFPASRGGCPAPVGWRG